MKLKPRDLGILALVVVIAVAAVFYTTSKFGGGGDQAPTVVGKASTETPSDPKAANTLKVPNETAN